MKRRMLLVLAAGILAGGCATPGAKKEVPAARPPAHVFYGVRTTKPLDIEHVNRTLDEKKIGRSVIKHGWGSAWHRNVAGDRITVYASVDLIWIYARVEDPERARDALHWLVAEAGALVGASLQDEGSYRKLVKWPKEEKPGKRIPEGIMLPQGAPKIYLSFLSEVDFRNAHAVSGKVPVELEARGSDLYWVSRAKKAPAEAKAASLVRPSPAARREEETSEKAPSKE